MDKTITLTFKLNQTDQAIHQGFGYILNRANEDGYFAPRFSKSDLFEIFDAIMVAYTDAHGGTYNADTAAHNMELFFNSPTALTDDERRPIDEAFEAQSERTKEWENGETTVKILIHQKEAGTFVLNLTQGEDTLDEMERAIFEGNTEETDGILEGHRETPIGQDVRPQTLHTFLLKANLDRVQKEANVLNGPLVRMVGIGLEDMHRCHRHILTALYVLASESDYKEEPHWTDLVSFIYNEDGDSGMRLSEYAANESEEHVGSVPNRAMHISDLLALQKHFLYITQPGPVSDRLPLTKSSQWLLAFTDSLALTMTYLEEEIA